MMRKFILLSVLLIAISGCSDTEGFVVEVAHQKCADHGGVSSLGERLFVYNARCLNGTYFKHINKTESQ